MTTYCAWCKRHLSGDPAAKPASHGICLECVRVYFPEIETGVTRRSRRDAAADEIETTEDQMEKPILLPGDSYGEPTFPVIIRCESHREAVKQTYDAVIKSRIDVIKIAANYPDLLEAMRRDALEEIALIETLQAKRR